MIASIRISILSDRPPDRARVSQSDLYFEINESLCDIGVHGFPERRDTPFCKAWAESSMPRAISAAKSEVESILLQEEIDSRIDWR